MRILVVEDDAGIAAGLQANLQQRGYAVDWCETLAHAWAALQAEAFDAVLLDLGLPDGDGGSLLQRLRQASAASGKLPHPDTPVLIMTAREEVQHRIAGLNLGADDYLVKPFDVDELKARIRALLRRSFSRAQPVLEYREVSLDPVAQQVSYRGQPVALQRKEFLLLHELLAQPGRVLTRDRLQQVLYGWDEEAESNALEVHIHHLRKKLFPELIRTVRGVGYLVDKA